MPSRSLQPESDSLDDCTDTQALRNIGAVSSLEQQALERRNLAERCSDFIVKQTGQMSVIVLHSVWIGSWVVWNSGGITYVRPFDPFPYAGLTAIVALEASFLSLFILISQNRSSRRADERAQLDLQVNLLAEHEATKMLQLLRALCAYHQLPEAEDTEVMELVKRTEPAIIARELEQRLPSETTTKQESQARL